MAVQLVFVQTGLNCHGYCWSKYFKQSCLHEKNWMEINTNMAMFEKFFHYTATFIFDLISRFGLCLVRNSFIIKQIVN